MIVKSDSKSSHSVKCGICRTEIIDRIQIYQAGISFGVVCGDCYRQFSAEDLEMMTNMFIAYGGYFGMQKGSHFSLVKTLEIIMKNALRKKKILNTEQVNIRLMHQAILHGISPEQYVQDLSVLGED
ncbi:MAG: hypothetical protein ACW96X_08090 [Promethearchaeota archaeon]|jgi:hypothetical protein